MICAPGEYLDQPVHAHAHSLIRGFDERSVDK